MLPKDYKVPMESSKYLRLTEGDHQFRILGEPILGFVYWVDKKPHRVKMDGLKDISSEYKEEASHFWAMPIYNTNEERVQILEIAKTSIQKEIRELELDEDWGDPMGEDGYDILITRTGTTFTDTKYAVKPKPRKPLKDGVMAYYKELGLKLDVLFDGGDPWENVTTPDEDKKK